MWHLKSIQYLRGIAATMVVMTHVLRTADVLADFHFIGAAGVDIFFVISGFLMWSINNKNERTAAEFMLDRLARIVPLYWVVTLLIVCLAVFTPFYKDADIGATYVWKSLLFIPDFQPGTLYVRPLLGVSVSYGI